MPILTSAVAKRNTAVPVVTNVSTEAGGDQIQISGNEILRIKNTGGSTRTVTFDSRKQDEFGVDQNESVAIAAGATVICGPFRTDRWADGQGYLNLSYSAGTAATLEIEIDRALFGQADKLSR